MRTIIKNCTIAIMAAIPMAIAHGQTPAPPDVISFDQLAPVHDPLDAPANCYPPSITYASLFVNYDIAKTSESRALKRLAYDNTVIEAQIPNSHQWITRCPVQIAPGQTPPVLNQPVICNPREVFNYGELFIANSGADLVFRIDTAMGTFQGNLAREPNPHGSNTHSFNRHINPEIVWLRSTNAELIGSSTNQMNYEFYIFLQNRAGKKYYVVEAFEVPNDLLCEAHRPGQHTLCINDHTPGNCMLSPLVQPNMPQLSRQSNSLKYRNDTFLTSELKGPEFSKNSERYEEGIIITSQGSIRKPNYSQAKSLSFDGHGKQGDTGGGHEPIELVIQ